MNERKHIAAIGLAAMMLATAVCAQTPLSAAAPPAPKPSDGVLVDQVIAVVNGDLVLESDVEEEKRLDAFQPFSHPADEFSRADAINRLIDRTLILQEAKLQPGCRDARSRAGRLPPRWNHGGHRRRQRHLRQSKKSTRQVIAWAEPYSRSPPPRWRATMMNAWPA